MEKYKKILATVLVEIDWVTFSQFLLNIYSFPIVFISESVFIELLRDF